MRLIYIANIRLPTEKAHGIQIMKMCEAFARTGADVTLVVPTRRNPQLGKIDPFEYYGVERNFSIKYLSTCDPVWMMKLPAGVYIQTQSFFFRRALRSYFRKHLGIGIKLLSQEYYDSTTNSNYVAYTRDEYLLPFVLKYSKNVVWEAHTLPRHRRRYLKYWKRCRAIVTITNTLKEKVVKCGAAPEKILVAHDGVDLEKFDMMYRSNKSDRLDTSNKTDTSDTRKILGLPLDKKIVMYAGHLYEWKGAHTLLQTAKNFQFLISSATAGSRTPFMENKVRDNFQTNPKSQIPNPNVDVLFVFVGGTEQDVKKFRQKAEEMKLQNVLIVGHRSPTEVPKWLAAADVLVLPNSAQSEISRLYTSPMKLFEYMASGRSIVASDVPSIREVLNESNVLFVRADDPEALARGIMRALDDRAFSERIARQAQYDVQEYDWGKRAERILRSIEHYPNVLEV